MKLVWIASLALCATPVIAQTTIYKHVDESGHITYSNKPMKGATVLDLEPLTTVPGAPVAAAAAHKTATVTVERTEASKPDAKPVGVVTTIQPSLASVEPQLQKRRDNER